MMQARFYALLLVGATALAVTGSEVSLKTMPGFYAGGWEYKVDPYIRTALSLQALGKDKACEKLLELPKAERKDLDESQKVVVLCRMLFVAKAGGKFRRPMIGGARFLGGTGYSDWPLEPIELVGGIPFFVTAGYVLGGRAEAPESYVSYCVTNCMWSSYQWRIPTKSEKRTALGTLLSSQKWKTPLTQWEKDFLSAQIEGAK